MTGLDDLIGGLTSGGKGGSGGLEDLLGGVLGTSAGQGSGGSSVPGGLGGLLGGLLGGGSDGQAGGAGNLVAALAPLVGGLLAGGGLQKLLGNLQSSGLGAQADSWVGTGENLPVTGAQLEEPMSDAVDQVAQTAGISREEAADVLAKLVPQVVNGLTPDGQVPSEDELRKLLDAVKPAT